MAGFSVTRTIAADPAHIFRHFTQQAAFARWFVVPGFTTPPDRISLDPHLGGRIAGVLVSKADGAEVPFTAAYGRIEEPTYVEFRFTDPEETVSISLSDEGGAGTRLTYRNEGSPAADHAEALEGVTRMLDALAESATLREGWGNSAC